MLPVAFLITVVFAACKPHRALAAKPSNKPLQATETFTGTICASCEEAETCSADTTVIESATVTVDGTETEVTIDDEGSFGLSLEDGDHTIVVTATCPFRNGTESTETATSTQTVTIESPVSKATAVFVLQCSSLCNVTVPVVVQVCSGCNETLGCDAENGTALVEGKMMALVPVNGSNEAQTATIDSEGNATFDAVAPGDYYVHVYEDPYGSSTIEVAGQITVEEPADEEEEPETQYYGPLVVANATLCYDPTYITGKVCADCEAEPPAEGEISNGTATTGCTTPLANATVRLTVMDEEGNEVAVEAETDDQGNFELEPANVTGNYTLEVISPSCSGDEESVFAEVTGEINATSPEPELVVNVSAFCSAYCTANITGQIYTADNETANYTEGITTPIDGVTVDLIEGPYSRPGDVLASAVTNSTGQYEFLFVPFGEYTITARDVPTAGGPTGEGCGLSYDDISIGLEVSENITYNTTIVRAEECNNGTLCGQILIAANYCTNSTGVDENSTTPGIFLTIPATNCSCFSNSSLPPIYPIRPVVPPGQVPPPPPFSPNVDLDRLWRAFLLGTNYPTSAPLPPPPPPHYYAYYPDSNSSTDLPPSSSSSSDPTSPSDLSSSALPLTNQRLIPPPPPRCPSGCGCACNRPPCQPCPPCRPFPPFPPFPPGPNCTCTINGSFEGCFEVISPFPTAVARLFRLASVDDPAGEETANQTFQYIAETEVYANGSFCFVGLPEGDNYYLEISVSENDTLDLTLSNISDALGAITSTLLTQEGAFPPTQQVVSFGPILISGAPDSTIDPFTAVFTNTETANSSIVTLTNATFIPANTTANDTNSSGGNGSVPITPIFPITPQMRYVDPFGQTYMYPLSSNPASSSSSSSSVQIVTPSSKKALKKPRSRVLREKSSVPSSSSSTSSITIIRPQQTPAKQQTTRTKASKGSSNRHTVSVARTPTSSSSSSTTNKNKSSQQKKSSTHTKSVTKKQVTTSTTSVTRRG